MARMSKAVLAAQEVAEANARLVQDELDTLTEEQRDLLAKREIEVTVAYKCEDCGEVMEEDELDTLYECGECGSKAVGQDEGKRCDDCNKFRGRVDDKYETTGCMRCGEGQVEPVVVADPDGSGDMVELETAIEAIENAADDEAEEADAERGQRKRRANLSPDPIPVTEEVPASRLQVGDWYLDDIRTAGGTDTFVTRSIDITESPRPYGDDHVQIGSSVLRKDAVVRRVLRWERPAAAYDIAARDLTLLHVVCDPKDWSVHGRIAFTEIRTDLTTGRVECFNKYRRKDQEPVVTYAADDPLVVVDRDKDSLFGRPAFEVHWEVPVERYTVVGDLLDGNQRREPNPVGVEFFRRLEEAGLPTNTVGRKHYLAERGSHGRQPFARFIERKPRQVLKLVEILNDMQLKPVTITQITANR